MSIDLSGIADAELRRTLEVANSYLDDASKLVHPPAEIDADKAAEIERLTGLFRKNLAKARAMGNASIGDLAALLEITAQTFEGLALAFGRNKLAKGAQLIEASVDAYERLGKKSGTDDTQPLSLYTLGLIHAQLGSKEKALSFMRRAVKADPDDIDYRKALDELESTNAALMFAGSDKGQSLIKWLIVIPFKVFVAWPLKFAMKMVGIFFKVKL